MPNTPTPAPDAEDDVVHHVAFDFPGRRQLWRPPVGQRAFSVAILGRMAGVGEEWADFDTEQVTEALQTITRLTRGDVGWVWAHESGRPAEITLEVIPHFDFWPEFRGGMCYPHVAPDGVLIGSRIAFTPWERRMWNGALLHELAHGMVGFGHTPDRGDCHVMGSCPDAHDFSAAEYAAWAYMRPLAPGSLNPRPPVATHADAMRPTLDATVARMTATLDRPLFACPIGP